MNKWLVSMSAAAVAAGAMAVESANVVGVFERIATGYTIFNPSFEKVGGGESDISDLIDVTQLTGYVDEIDIYNPDDGLTYPFVWDGVSGWTDYDVTTNIVVEPGKLYMANFLMNTKVSGQVVNSSTLVFEHDVPAGFSFFGSAFPEALKTSNFNFGDVMTPYVDEIAIYNPEDGLSYSYVWDGTGFTDYENYLNDELAPMGEGIMINNAMGFTGLTETL